MTNKVVWRAKIRYYARITAQKLLPRLELFLLLHDVE